MKRGFIFLSIVLVIAATILALYYINRNAEKTGSLFKAVPLDAAFIIDVPDYNSFQEGLKSNPSLREGFLSLPFFRGLIQDISRIDSFSRQNEVARKILSHPYSLMISGHPYRKAAIQCLYYFKLNSSSEFESIDQAIRSSQGIMVGSLRSYDHAFIRDISMLGKINSGFSYTYLDGILIISPSSILLENAIRHLSTKENILDQGGLDEIARTAGKSTNLNVYLNFKEFPRLASSIIHVKYNQPLNYIRKFGSWAELDLTVKPDMVIFNGFSRGNTNNQGVESIFKNQKPVRFDSFSKIPANTSTFVLLGISNFDNYVDAYQAFADNTDAQTKMDQLKADYGIDIIPAFRNLFDHEAGVVYLGDETDTFPNTVFSILRINSKEDAKSTLNNFIEYYAEKANVNGSDLVLKADSDSGPKIYSLPFANLPSLLFGKLFDAGENRYCTLLDNYMIFGNSPGALSKYLKQLLSKHGILNDEGFSNFSEYFSSQGNFFFYNKPVSSSKIYHHFLRADVVSEIFANPEQFNTLQAMVYQFNMGDNGLIYNSLFLKFSKKLPDKKIKPVWELQLDDSVIRKPELLSFEKSKNENILVQDARNQIYLISGNGTIQWKIQVDGPIMGKIQRIDFFRNGKKQILFNTHSKIYLIDRNGHLVDPYPVTIRSQATNGLAVFDYNRDRNYRIFIATSDHRILCLDKKANSKEGWEFGKTNSDVSLPVQYFRIEKKDYLTCKDKDHIYILNRRGKEVGPVNLHFPVSASNPIGVLHRQSLQDARFLVSDTSGQVYFISSNGSYEKRSFGTFPADHWFDVCDINHSTNRDLIFTWNKQVAVFSQEGKELLSLNAGHTISYPPCIYELLPERYYLGLVSDDDQKIYLFDRRGEIYNGFPLRGNTQFSIEPLNNSENSFNLIVGRNKNFLVKYTVKLAN